MEIALARGPCAARCMVGWLPSVPRCGVSPEQERRQWQAGREWAFLSLDRAHGGPGVDVGEDPVACMRVALSSSSSASSSSSSSTTSASTSPARVSTREPDQPTASSATAAAVPLPRRSAARNQRKAHHTGLVARLLRKSSPTLVKQNARRLSETRQTGPAAPSTSLGPHFLTSPIPSHRVGPANYITVGPGASKGRAWTRWEWDGNHRRGLLAPFSWALSRHQPGRQALFIVPPRRPGAMLAGEGQAPSDCPPGGALSAPGALDGPPGRIITRPSPARPSPPAQPGVVVLGGSRRRETRSGRQPSVQSTLFHAPAQQAHPSPFPSHNTIPSHPTTLSPSLPLLLLTLTSPPPAPREQAFLLQLFALPRISLSETFIYQSAVLAAAAQSSGRHRIIETKFCPSAQSGARSRSTPADSLPAAFIPTNPPSPTGFL
ncbi:hypothetical protein PCL_00698 [Purpureocillium lilacinum]|uniref:Uncharacterized protein n=1 Tax=Purpureocillium lilacinum TaxID=33203 RepID=A0A2U3E5M4_PURLI|nr:hypothetical protein PCL_00698 [Purpureocillium lilacinum]